jgi:hypothetical protein
MNAPDRSLVVRLPSAQGRVEAYALREPRAFPQRPARAFTRVAYSAAHVVADALADVDPWLTAAIDWDATLAYRRYLWSLGLGVAEAMDTAQRGMGLDWPTSLTLVRRTLDAARDVPGAMLASGVGTDHLSPDDARTVDDVIAAYEQQMEAVEALGGRMIVMASRALVRVARTPGDYERVYDRILRQARAPVILHWLGEMFDPALAGYWGNADHMRAMETALGVIAANAAKVDGIKISLLDAGREIDVRRRLPRGVRCYTGDDFNYPELIAGDERGFSHALLGIFDPLAPLAAAALRALDTGDVKGFRELLDPSVELSRHLFQAPTRFYKTGVVFLAWLAGHQDHFAMVGHQQSARSLPHLARAYELADTLGLFPDPELAAARMRGLLGVYGVTR